MAENNFLLHFISILFLNQVKESISHNIQDYAFKLFFYMTIEVRSLTNLY